MIFTLLSYTSAFSLRTIFLIVAVTLLAKVEGYSNTVVIPATGGTNLCVGGDYVALGDITVMEGDMNDFEKDQYNKEFILQVPSANFEFKTGVGSVAATLSSLSITINSITVTATEIIVNYDILDNDLTLEGFVISGIQVRAVNTTDAGFIVRKSSLNINDAHQQGNDPSDNVNHASLISINGLLAPPVLSSSDVDNIICPGETVTFTATAATATYYEFLIDGISVQNSTSNTYSSSSLTNGQAVTVKSIPSTGCASVPSNSIVITVNSPPVVSVASSDADNTICMGESVKFTATSATASTYEFFVNGVSVQSGTSDNFIAPSLTNGQTVTVRVYDGSCYTLSTGITISVNPVPFVILTSSELDQTICAGSSVTFAAFASMPITSYNFLVNGVSWQNSASSTFSTISLSDADIVTVEAVTAATCSALSNPITFSVKSLPVVSLTSGDADNIICDNEYITFTATPATAAAYDFYVDGFLVQSSASNQYSTNSLINGQAVRVKVISSDGCSTISPGIVLTVNNLPTVNLTSDKSVICSGESITFTATSATATNFEFFVDGVSMQNGASTTYSTSSLTNGQTVTVQASDGNTCTAVSKSFVAIVNPLPIISLSSSDTDNVICMGETVTFTASSATGAYYEFFVNGVSVQNSTFNKYSTNSLINGQVITVRAITAGGCASANSPGSMITVNPIPVISLASSDSDNIICPGENITFTATSATATSFEFFVNGTTVQNSSANVYTSNSLINGQKITVTASDANGCQAVSSGIVVQVSPLVVTLLSSDANNSICAGETVTFTANASTATAYEFFIDGVSIQNGASTTYSTSSLTNGQTVTVRATTASGCSALSGGITTIVNNIPFINLIVSDADNMICAGDAVTFTANAPTATNYEFFVNGTSVQNSATNLYSTNSLTNGQIVTVQATTASGCTYLHTGVVLTVNPLPSVNISSSDADNAICAGQSVTFTATSATGTAYNFFVDGFSRQNGISNQYITSTLANGQTVSVKVIDNNGCFIVSSGVTTTVNQVPSVLLSSSDADNTICPGESITFTATSATAANFEFFVDGVSMQNGASTTYSTSSLTNGQTVTVRATTASGCSTLSNGITTFVNILNAILGSSDADNMICAGDAVTFTANAPTATNYEFFVNGTSVQNSATNLYITNSLTNGQTVTVQATTASGCTDMSFSITMVVNPLPTVSLSSSDTDNTICAGQQIIFTATSPTASMYEFFVDNILVQNSSSKQYITNSLLNGQVVKVKAVTAANCFVISNGITTVVNEIPIVVLNSSDADNTICPGETISFTANAPTATNYEFFVNGTSVQNTTSNIYTTTALTNGQVVTVKVTAASGCYALSSGITISVTALSVTLSSSDADNIICPGESITFTANSATATNFEFFVDGVSMQNGASNTYLTSSLTNGQSIFVVASVGICSVNSNSIPVAVELMTVSLGSSDADNRICPGESITFTANSATAATYEFFVDGASVQNGASTKYITSSLTDGQIVSVKALSASGCEAVHSGINTDVEDISVVLTSSDADNVICTGDAVTFVANAPMATNYEFFVDGASVQNGASNTYLTNSLTNGQSIFVKVTNSYTCSTLSSGITTTVNPLPTVTLASSDADNVICAGETLTFTASSATAVNYEFFIDGLSVQNSGSNKYITSALTNGQTVTVRVTTANSCSTESSGITTTVNPVATVNAGTDQVVCANETITLSGSKGGAASLVTWSGGKGIFGEANALSTTYIADPSEIGKTVILTLTTNDPDGSGPCVYVEDQVRITINALPNVLFSGLNPEYCIDDPEVTLTGFPIGGFFSGPGIVTGTSKFKPSDAGAGTHVIRYTYTDGNNCTNYIERSVIVHPLPVVSFTGFNNSGPGGSAIYPQDAPLINLMGFPAGGTFLGQGISGSTFSASAAGAGTYVIRYIYQDANKCMNYQEQTVVVAPLPNVGIGDIPSPFCSKDPDFILTGTPAGGTFSGPGIITNTSIFRPSSAFIGVNVIRYTYTDPVIGGTNFVEKTVIVNKVPDVTFSGLNSAYCEDAPNIILNGFPADNDGAGGVIGTFKGPGILPGTSVFSPSAAGVGIHTITYVYTNENGCTDSTKNSVIVHALPLVTFSGLDAAYCVDASAVKLTGFPVGGTFSGLGISGATFIPSLAGVGTHLIRYTYTNSNGCVNIQEQAVVINQIPTADFTFFNVCDKDSVWFEDNTPEGLSGNIQSWEWNFGDPLSGNVNTSNLQHPKHLFTTPGEYSVTLKVTSEYGCTDTQVIAVTVGGIPQPDFTWADICFNESADFTAQTFLSIGTISSWEWNFGDGTSQVYTNVSDKVTHLYPKAGKYTVTLKVTTNFACSNSVSKQIYILPSIASYPYIENFEQSTGGWVEDGVNVSWGLGTPSGTTINTAASGSSAWYTGSALGYNPNEKSFVYSPCFDFTHLQKPLISVKIWNHTQKGFDGAVLQYSINGGIDWKNVGTIDEGINWYNQAAIVGNPGNQPIGQSGWSGTESGWVEAKHALDFLKGESSVRFRMAFGSNADNPPGQPLDGFAFDDVYIGERDKIVLLEHFTNSENTEAIGENNIINNLMDNSGGEIISIQYHTNFPGVDPLNVINPADPSARALYYGVPQTPRTALDGYIKNDKFSQWALLDLSKRKLAAAAFSIDLNLTQNGPSSLHIDADITSKFDFNDTLFVYAAIVEKQIADAYNGAPIFRNVLRKLLPDAAGILLSKTWSPGSTEKVDFSWEVINIKDPTQLAVIVFVQDAVTKEVYQAVMKEPGFIPEVITGTEDNNQQQKIIVYPNPASNQAYLSFENGASQNGEWYIYDVLGRVVDSGEVQKGQKQVKIVTRTFPQGTYLLQVNLKDKRTLYQKLIIHPSR